MIQKQSHCLPTVVLIRVCIIYFYRPRSEASEGYVFTGVCHSVIFGGREVGKTNGQPPPPPGTRSEHLPPPPPPGTRSEHLPPPPLPPGSIGRRAVRILLECILVFSISDETPYLLDLSLSFTAIFRRSCGVLFKNSCALLCLIFLLLYFQRKLFYFGKNVFVCFFQFWAIFCIELLKISQPLFITVYNFVLLC